MNRRAVTSALRHHNIEAIDIGERFQPYPQTGQLADNMNWPLDRIKGKLRRESNDVPVYAYVMTTVKAIGSDWEQQGCGPNFQGGLITLCTCKHRMRSYPSVAPGIWIAAFSGVNETIRGSGLFYLAKVAQSYESHYDLWNSLPKDIRQAKSASQHRLGDIYEPKSDQVRPNHSSRFEWQNYRPPHPNHAHIQKNGWHEDVNYVGAGGCQARLLVCDPEKSFIWSRPSIFYGANQHPRTRKRGSLQEFLRDLVS